MALSTNLVAYYKLDGNSNDSVGSNNGSDTGITYGSSYGKIGQGALFNGTSSKIVIGTSSTFNFERTDSFSISAWVNTTTFNNGPILSKLVNSGSYNGYEVLVVGGNIVFLMNNTDPSNGISVSATSNTMSTGSWYHVVVTYSGTSLASGVKMYVNGSLCSQSVNFDNLSASILSSVAPQIGARPSGNVTNGDLDEIGIWSRALSADEVSQLYNGGAGLSYPFGTTYTRTFSDSITNGASRSVALTYIKGMLVSLSDSIMNGASRVLTLTRGAISYTRALTDNILNGASRVTTMIRGAISYTRNISDSIMNGVGRYVTTTISGNLRPLWSSVTKTVATWANNITKQSSSWTNKSKNN